MLKNLMHFHFVFKLCKEQKIDKSFLPLIKTFTKEWWWKGLLEIYAKHNEMDFKLNSHTHIHTQGTWHLIMARRLKLILRAWRMMTTKETIAGMEFFANILCRQLFFYLKEVLLLSSCQTLIKGLCIVCFMLWT